MSHRAARFHDPDEERRHAQAWSDRFCGMALPMFQVRMPLVGTIEYMVVNDGILTVVTTHGVARVDLYEERG